MVFLKVVCDDRLTQAVKIPTRIEYLIKQPSQSRTTVLGRPGFVFLGSAIRQKQAQKSPHGVVFGNMLGQDDAARARRACFDRHGGGGF